MCTSTTLALKYNVQAALCFLYSFVIVFTDTRKVLDNSIDTVIIIGWEGQYVRRGSRVGGVGKEGAVGYDGSRVGGAVEWEGQ